LKQLLSQKHIQVIEDFRGPAQATPQGAQLAMFSEEGEITASEIRERCG